MVENNDNFHWHRKVQHVNDTIWLKENSWFEFGLSSFQSYPLCLVHGHRPTHTQSYRNFEQSIYTDASDLAPFSSWTMEMDMEARKVFGASISEIQDQRDILAKKAKNGWIDNVVEQDAITPIRSRALDTSLSLGPSRLFDTRAGGLTPDSISAMVGKKES
jgi:hypothetical protein